MRVNIFSKQDKNYLVFLCFKNVIFLSFGQKWWHNMNEKLWSCTLCSKQTVVKLLAIRLGPWIGMWSRQEVYLCIHTNKRLWLTPSETNIREHSFYFIWDWQLKWERFLCLWLSAVCVKKAFLYLCWYFYSWTRVTLKGLQLKITLICGLDSLSIWKELFSFNIIFPFHLNFIWLAT